jgi:hypothetical protein
MKNVVDLSLYYQQIQKILVIFMLFFLARALLFSAKISGKERHKTTSLHLLEWRNTGRKRQR